MIDRPNTLYALRLAGPVEALRHNRYWAAALVFYVAMLALLAIKPIEQFFVWTFNEKLLHLLAYSLIALLLYAGARIPIVARIIFSLGLTALLGAVDELTQYLIPHRDPSFDSWVVDCAGAILTVMVMAVGELVWVAIEDRKAAGGADR